MKARIRHAVLVLLAVASAFIPSASMADRTRVVDTPAHDSESAAFDIEWVKHGHAGRKLSHVISTYDTWRVADLGDNGTFQINISPGADTPASIRRIIVIYLEGSKLAAKMYNVSNGSEVEGHPEVSRPTSRSVKVTFPKRWVRRGIDAYRWEALFAEQSTEDIVPSDESSILHRLN